MSQIQALIEKARRYLRSAELLIQDGDYESNFSISEDNARHSLENARGFVDKVAEWLKSDLSDD
jgi:uncharacterized protein (UPF0332 family)